MSETALAKYNPSFSKSSGNMMFGLIILAVVLFLIFKSGGIGSINQYNAETVTIQRDERGRIAGMTVNRSAH